MNLKLRFSEGCEPAYMTPHSSHCDLYCRLETQIPPGKVALVPTGVWIDQYELIDLPDDLIPELQIRCRSSFPISRQLMVANGVGTVDIDYPDEIRVLLYNFGQGNVTLAAGERIAQMSLSTVHRIGGVKLVANKRSGGFGSTGNI